MTEPAASQLLEEALEGDRRAFERLVQRFHGNLLGVARSMLRHGESEEAVQDAWLAAWQNLSRFERRASFRTWVTRILINECRMRLRRGGRELTLDVTGDAHDVLADRFRSDGHWQRPPVSWDWHSPEELLAERDLRACLDANLARLPAQQRLVLELRDIQGLPLEDVCNLLDVSASNVRVLLHRARTSLFAVVEHYQETGEC